MPGKPYIRQHFFPPMWYLSVWGSVHNNNENAVFRVTRNRIKLNYSGGTSDPVMPMRFWHATCVELNVANVVTYNSRLWLPLYRSLSNLPMFGLKKPF
jgi:hypothetical protein